MTSSVHSIKKAMLNREIKKMEHGLQMMKEKVAALLLSGHEKLANDFCVQIIRIEHVIDDLKRCDVDSLQ